MIKKLFRPTAKQLECRLDQEQISGIRESISLDQCFRIVHVRY